MPGAKKKRDTGCPFAYALDAFGDRWSLLVIRDLMFRGKKTYGEFLDGKERIATNVLADRLSELETEGIIVKRRDPDNRRRFLYTLTEKGWELAPLMVEIMRWSTRHDPNTAVQPHIVDKLAAGREEFLADLRACKKN